MPRLLEAPCPTFTTDDNSGNVSLTLSSGIEVELREPRMKDLRTLENFVSTGEKGQIDTAFKMITLLCVKWGDKKAVSDKELGELTSDEFKEVSEALNSFRAFNTKPE